jgi:RNA polymerase sigma-70 factor (ECF subfamily)
MPSSEFSFDELIQRLRQGDTAAAGQLVEAYGPEVRRFVRFRLTTPAMRRLVDSLDISQSVFAKFFVKFESGSLTVEDPDQLRRLLITMARNKIYDHARKHRAQPAHVELTPAGEIADRRRAPDEQLANAELAAQVQERLSDEERYLLDQRFAGREWQDLAAELNSTAEALRKRLNRAVDRVARELRIIE